MATESQSGLKTSNDSSLFFNNKMMSVNTLVEGTNDRFIKCFKLKGAMNYG